MEAERTAEEPEDSEETVRLCAALPPETEEAPEGAPPQAESASAAAIRPAAAMDLYFVIMIHLTKISGFPIFVSDIVIHHAGGRNPRRRAAVA